MKLIASANVEAAEKVIAENNLTSASNFISLYNSGMLNKGSSIVTEIAKAISLGYKNVDLKNKFLHVSSSEEVELEEAIEYLSIWSRVLKLKREVSEVLSQNGNKDFYVRIYSDGNAVKRSHSVLAEDGYTTETSWLALGTEDIFTRKADVKAVFDKVGLPYEEIDLGEAIELSSDDIQSLDSSFISELSVLLPL